MVLNKRHTELISAEQKDRQILSCKDGDGRSSREDNTSIVDPSK